MNTSNKTLLQNLVEELPKHGGWPKFDREMQVVQDDDGEVKFHFIDHPLEFERNNPGTWGSNTPEAWLEDFAPQSNFFADRSSDYTTAIITREQYESALAAKNDGWIEWGGGEYPFKILSLIDVKFRNGDIEYDQYSTAYYWDHTNSPGDIIAYRLHQPQKAEQAKADDEADLDECIGQAPAPVYSGYGVPPVGAAIEWREGRRWYPGTVTAIGEQLIIIKDQHGEEGSYSLEHTDFRRANFEVDELAAVIDASDEGGELIPSHQKAIAKHLIDAGYRKQ